MTAILTCSQRDMLLLANVTSNQHRQDRFRDQTVAAFGTAAPVLENHALVLDAVAMCVQNELGASALSGIAPMARRAAASIVRNFWPEWAEALSWVEYHQAPIVFAVAEMEGKGGWWCGNGRADKLPEFVIQRSPLRRLFCVNLAQIIIDINERATKAGLDLSTGSIILPPDDPNFVEWLKEFRERRDAMLKKFDPLHAKNPPRPSAAQRAAIEAITCLH